jgi:hypothetical protein
MIIVVAEVVSNGSKLRCKQQTNRQTTMTLSKRNHRCSSERRNLLFDGNATVSFNLFILNKITA